MLLCGNRCFKTDTRFTRSDGFRRSRIDHPAPFKASTILLLSPDYPNPSPWKGEGAECPDYSTSPVAPVANR